MSNRIKWTGYLYMSLLSFSAFLLEYVSIFVIEGFFLHVDIWNYTPYQRSIHCIIMAVLWAAVIGSILLFSRRRYDFPVKNLDTEKISSRDWIAAFLCLAACKVMTFIDWHTWKIIGEAKGKTNLCKICNIKQIITYAKLGVQPVWIDEGYGGKLIAYYFIPETKVAWKYWLENRPDTGQAKNAADRGGNRSAGWE